MIKTREIPADHVAKSTWGYKNGNVIFVFRNTIPWRECEICPLITNFDACYDEVFDYDYIDTTSKLTVTHDLQGVIQEAYLNGVVSERCLQRSKEDEEISMYMRIPNMTVAKFKVSTILKEDIEAAKYKPQPISPIKINDINFTSADLHCLSRKLHEYVRIVHFEEPLDEAAHSGCYMCPYNRSDCRHIVAPEKLAQLTGTYLSIFEGKDGKMAGLPEGYKIPKD